MVSSQTIRLKIFSLFEAKLSVHLQPPIQRPGDGDALGGLSSASRDGGYQTVQLISLLLQLLDEGLYCSLAECFALSALSAHAIDSCESCSLLWNWSDGYLWHIRLCTMERQASAEVGALAVIFPTLTDHRSSFDILLQQQPQIIFSIMSYHWNGSLEAADIVNYIWNVEGMKCGNLFTMYIRSITVGLNSWFEVFV